MQLAQDISSRMYVKNIGVGGKGIKGYSGRFTQDKEKTYYGKV